MANPTPAFHVSEPPIATHEFHSLTGVASVNGKNYNVSGDLILGKNGSIHFIGDSSWGWHEKPDTVFNIELISSDGWSIVCENCFITSA